MAKSKKAKASKPKGAKKDSTKSKARGKSKDGKKKGSKKKGKKQPLSKRDMELAKLRSEKEEQERLKREAEEKAAADKKLAIEMALRAGHLIQSVSIIQTYDKWVIGKVARQKSLQEWNTFKACRNLPDFSKMYEVNSYLAYWLNQLDPPLMKKLLRLSPEFLQLVGEMRDFLEIPPDNIRLDLIRELGLLYRDMVDYQHVYLDKCTYAIMEDMSDLFDPEVGVCDYLLSIPEITHCLWGNLFACPDINEHEFQELQFKFKIPETLLTAHGIYRLVKTEYDHFSDSCLSYFAPGVENALKQSILDWIEKHALASGDYTELQSPEEMIKASKSRKSKGGKGKKKKKKRKGSKKRHKSGKKGKRGKSGSSSADTDYADMDEETRKFMMELDAENQKSQKEKKKKTKSKKGKKGKKGGKGKGNTTDYSTTGNTTTDTEDVEEEEGEDGEGDETGNETDKKKEAKRVVTEDDVANQSKETKEERRARRRREAEEESEMEFDFSMVKMGGQDESNLYDDDDENTTSHKKHKEGSIMDTDDSKHVAVKIKKKDETDKKVKKTKSKAQKEKQKSKPSIAGVSKNEKEESDDRRASRKSEIPDNRKSKRQSELQAEEDRERKRSSAIQTAESKKSISKAKKSKAGGKKSKSKANLKSKSKSKAKLKSKSKSKAKVKGAKSKKKQAKGKSKASVTEKDPAIRTKAKKALETARSQIKDETKTSKKIKIGKSKPKVGDKDEDESESKKEKVKKSKSKLSTKQKSKTEASTARGRSKDVKRTESARKSPGGSKSKSKSGSRGRSKTPKGKGGSKSSTKSGSKGRKSKSRSTSGSKKGKKKGKKKKGAGKSKSKERQRPKTEAELAKERERAEKAKFIPQLHDHEMNLRNYTILGGVYNFNLLEMPPQPRARGRWTIHLKESDTTLKELAFEADYLPPTPLDQESAKKTPEEMEKEAKRQEEELQKLVLVDMAMPPSVQFPSAMGLNDEDEEEEALRLQKMHEESEAQFEAEKERRFNQLLTVEVTAPKIALWFEPPTPVRWDPIKRIWSTDGFFDIKFNENTLQLSFKTVRFGIMGFGHNRWSNLPYQSWELKPLGKDKVSFALIAAMAVVEFIVMGDLVCVSLLDNVTNSEEVQNAILNKYMKPKLLIKTMRYHGLDIFPEIDSYAYVDGVLVKHFEAEDHLYQCMGLVSSAFNFQWSRWNLLAGRDKMVYQMRERHGTATPGNYNMVLTTPRKAIRINCTEVSPNYTEEPVVDFEYYADLLNLVRAVGTDQGLRVINQTNPHHVEAVRILLSSLRPLSFS